MENVINILITKWKAIFKHFIKYKKHKTINDITYMWNLKHYTSEPIYKTKIDSQTQ